MENCRPPLRTGVSEASIGRIIHCSLLFDKMFSIEDLYEELLDDVKIKFFTKEELETYIQKIYNKISLYPDLATLYGNKIIHSIEIKLRSWLWMVL